VVRNGFGTDLADALLADLRTQTDALMQATATPIPLLPGKQRSGFAH
jgi:hypothetical protein